MELLCYCIKYYRCPMMNSSLYYALLQDSLIKPVTKILFGVAVITLLITLVTKETPQWVRRLNVFGGNFPPWILACMVIVFTRMRKRTKDFLKKYGL